MIKKSKSIGVCPYCGSTDIDYSNTEIEGEMLGYKFVCNACHKKSIEWYELKFVETVGKE